MLPGILVTPFGGHGTTTIRKMWRRRRWILHVRPDYIFSPAIDTYDIHSVPVWDEKFKHHVGKGQLLLHRGKEWYKRTGLQPQTKKTISEGLLEFIEETPHNIMLFGKCSLSETWLTNNGIKDALFMVRNPLDAYDSLYGRQHPQWSKARGGPRSLRLAEYYCEQWNKAVYDMLCSHSTYGNPIVRYETLADDLKSANLYPLSALLGGVWYNKPKREFITPEIEECIKDLTGKYYSAIYDK